MIQQGKLCERQACVLGLKECALFKSQQAVLLATSFSLFMAVVYENRTGKVVDYQRFINQSSCARIAKPYHSGEYRRAADQGLKNRAGRPYRRYEHGVKCVPLSKWK